MESGCRVPANQTQTFGRVVHVLALDAVDAIASVAGHGAAHVKLRSQIKGVIASGGRTDLEQNISCCVTDSAGVRGDEAGVSSMLEGLVYRSCADSDYWLFPEEAGTAVPYHCMVVMVHECQIYGAVGRFLVTLARLAALAYFDRLFLHRHTFITFPLTGHTANCTSLHMSHT